MFTKWMHVTAGVAATLAVAVSAGPAAADAPKPAQAVSAPAQTTVVGASEDRAGALSGYWTAERMRAAVPADTVKAASADATSAKKPRAVATGPAAKVLGAAPAGTEQGQAGIAADVRAAGAFGLEWPGSQFTPPATTTGKIFFTNSRTGGNFTCSGSAVNSEAKNLVITAGHCVHGGRGGLFHSNVVFVPGYRDGVAPRGIWAARELWAFNAWIANSDQRWDVGAMIVHPLGGNRLVNVVGGQGIAWNLAAEQPTFALGYPGNKSGGQRLNYCSGTTFKRMSFIFWTGQIGLNCDMTFGSSGGPWLTGFNGQLGFVHSVVSNGNPAIPKFYGPYFDTSVGNLYNTLRTRF
jgi:V8-like Glu-specific endopeptidase